MCGIWLYLRTHKSESDLGQHNKLLLKKSFDKIGSRGPDESKYIDLLESNNIIIGFHRLAIMDLSTNGSQPFITTIGNKTLYTVSNGEIYNYARLCVKYNITLPSKSDCNVLPYLFASIGIESMAKELIGEYAFVICEIDNVLNTTKVYICRDRLGVRPIFVSGTPNELVISSELKGSPFLFSKDFTVEQFRPGHYACVDLDLYKSEPGFGPNPPPPINVINYTQYYSLQEEKTFENYFNLISRDNIILYNHITKNIDLQNRYVMAKFLIYNTFVKIIEDMMVSDRPVGCLLSGGLDSSLVAAIASIYAKRKNQKLHTFSIGLPGGTDEPYAKKVAEHIGSIHTHVLVTEDEFVQAVKTEVIPCIETYDITTVRASTGQYLICKWIRANTDIKVVLIGDGSDELTSGYMYFHKAPNSQASHDENIRLLEQIHYYDVLRADRGVASNGLEARVPYLDVRFVELYLSLKKSFRSCMGESVEKLLLRDSFNKLNNKLLPNEVLYRKKEAFSDGVSSMKKLWYVIM